ncbi:porin [Cupriavidus pinatubonensis]|uniref:porin n=1 Tax=Cupriavidus pinatubonensis TaxID=248026 RepID=UPI00112E8767|nr:porin [Cupriavidus pinatubonensis]TPQ39397.1 porin [Cupriavidus pinatubonensis]
MKSFSFIGRACLGGALLAASAGADAAMTLYGRIDTDIEYQRGPRGNAAQMVDNASRWGMRGNEDLGGSLRADFGLEQGFQADNGTATNPQFRNAFVGLSGVFGAFALGRLDSATSVGSPIYSQITQNVDFVIHDAGATAIGTKVLNARNRVSNALGYATPDFGGFSLRARINLAGPDPATPNASSPVKEEDDFRQYDTGLNYASGNFSAGLGYSRDAKTGGLVANDFRDKMQATAAYDFKFVNLYGVYGRDRYVGTASSRTDVRYWLAGFTVPYGAHSLTVNYMERDVQNSTSGRLRKAQAGYGYRLSKRTMPYVFFDYEDGNSRKPGDTVVTYGIGIQHKF